MKVLKAKLAAMFANRNFPTDFSIFHPVGGVVEHNAIGAEGLRFNSRACQIGHSDLPTTRHCCDVSLLLRR